MRKKYILEEVTMTRMVEFLNKNYKQKRSLKPFNTTDAQGYIKRGALPSYMGGNRIELSKKDTGTKLYNILKK